MPSKYRDNIHSSRATSRGTGDPLLVSTSRPGCAPNPGEQPDVRASKARIRIPNVWIGRLLDHKGCVRKRGEKRSPLDSPRAGAVALHEIATKLWRFRRSDQQLRERKLKADYGYGRRAARSGFAKVKSAGIMTRERAGPTWAREMLIDYILALEQGYVELPPECLTLSPEALAFICATLVCPEAQTTAHVGRRVGFNSRTSVRRILAEVSKADAIVIHHGPRGRILVARPGHIFDLVTVVPITVAPITVAPITDVPITDVPTESTCQGGVSLVEGSLAVPPYVVAGLRPPLREQPAAAAGRAPVARSTTTVGDYGVLADWRASPTFRRGEWVLKTAPGAAQPPVDCATWARMLGRYGNMPQHLTTPASYAQAMDLIDELAAVSRQEADHVAYGVAWSIAEAVRRRRTIRSLGFIAERLLRRASEGDLAWIYDVPSIEDPCVLGMAMGHARRFIAMLRERGIETHDRALLSTIQLEALVRMLGPAMSLAPEFEHRVAHAPAPREGHLVLGWAYVDRYSRRTTRQTSTMASSE